MAKTVADLNDEQRKSLETRVSTFTAEKPMQQESAQQVAKEFDLKEKSVIAFAKRNGVPYKTKERASKTGGAVESKENIVADISSLVGANMNSLEKGNKPQLQALRDYLNGDS